MRRGPQPMKAIERVLSVASARGFVEFCRRKRGSVSDVVIFSSEGTVVVRMVRTKRLYCTIAETERQFSDVIAGLRSVPPDPGRILELWVCGQSNTCRFFRIGPAGLTEIGRDGKPLGGHHPREVTVNGGSS